jgi:hypothetical protein
MAEHDELRNELGLKRADVRKWAAIRSPELG